MNGSVLSVMCEPWFDEHRSNPRFQAIAARLNIPAS